MHAYFKSDLPLYSRRQFCSIVSTVIVWIHQLLSTKTTALFLCWWKCTWLLVLWKHVKHTTHRGHGKITPPKVMRFNVTTAKCIQAQRVFGVKKNGMTGDSVICDTVYWQSCYIRVNEEENIPYGSKQLLVSHNYKDNWDKKGRNKTKGLPYKCWYINNVPSKNIMFFRAATTNTQYYQKCDLASQ